MFLKNTASQTIGVQMILAASGAAATGLTVACSVSKDGGAFGTASGTVSELGSTGYYKVALAQADTNGDHLAYNFTATGAIPVTIQAFTFAAAIPANVTQFDGSAVTASSGRPEVNVTHIAGSAVSTTAAQIGVNVVQISDDAVAAQNLESYCDGTTPQPVNITQVIGDPVQASSSKTTNWGGTP